MYNRTIDRRNIRIVLFAGILLAGALLVATMYNAAFGQDSGTLAVVEYTENDTDPVLTLTASDPEGAAPIFWSLVTDAADIDGVDEDERADHASFKISQSGVLAFKAKPSFEGASASGDDSYKVVVRATDGDMHSYFKVTVNVQDLEEKGSVKLQPTGQTAATLLQPQVGVGITAHGLTDGDVATANTTAWQWYRSSSKTAPGTMIAGETTAEYTPATADIGDYLRVVATYNDGRGSGKTAEAVSEYTTIARISSNTAPKFPGDSTTRVVLEGADKGTTIGNPVTATDGNSGERLTYWLTDGADNDLFDIDAMTGQLKVKTKLDYEAEVTDDDQCAAANACEVTVNVADSSGTSDGVDTIEVTISVINVDEKPTLTGLQVVEHPEGTTDLDSDLDANDVQAVTYTAVDPEGGSVTLSLSGTDASNFKLKDLAPPVDGSKALVFKEKPDFETPGDSNRDNVYQVTVVASDGANSGMRDVIVKVTDVAEDGKIAVAPAQPRVGTALTATPTDSDGVMSLTWKWRKLMVEDGAPCPAQDSLDWTPDPDTTLIKDAKSAAYTPVVKDNGYCLRVEASYLDMHYLDDTAQFAKSIAFVLGGKVQGSSANIAPEFADTRTTRYVPEDAMSVTGTMVNVGEPVKAKDTDTLAYTLGGADKGLFTIVQADDADTTEVDEEGQIQVKVGAELDHETKPRLTVTVTATDPRGGRDTITVTINVTDVDESPTATKLVITAPPYTENDTDPVLTLTASDPEGAAPIFWSLVTDAADIDGVDEDERADHASFKISQSGVLAFKAKPSFEGASASGDDSYKVVVRATDGDMHSYFKVTVNVQDLEEKGSVKLQPTGQTAATLLQPQVGVGITAHGLTDGDVATANTTAWQWYRSSSKTAPGTMIAGETTAEYTPATADIGDYLRVVATYNDGRGDGKTAEAVSEYTTISAITNNTAPKFPGDSTTRVVLEGADKGTTIGNPVTATDDDSGERLTYWLTDGADNDLFDIDAMTGQLKVKTKLDYEAEVTDDDQCAAANACEVTVNVADSSGTSDGVDTIEVTISVINVDEKPTLTGLQVVEHPEGTTDLDSDLDANDVQAVTYTAVDPEGGSVTLSLSGTDASNFKLKDLAPPVDGSKALVFKEKPDFETPGDSNRDNVYQVTVVASDGANSGMRDVIVKVTDVAEDGKIAVAPAQPRVGTALTATPTDSDGVMSLTWKWRKLMVEDGAPCPAQDSLDWTPDPDTTLIKDAKSAAYTPVVKDNGYCLRVEASYLDMHYLDDTAQFAKSIAFVLGGKVQGSSANMAPEFADTRTTRYVPEDAMSVTGTMVNVGEPVKAKDTDTLAYTLGGADKGLFTIDAAGQIQVKVGAKLDHETKPRLTVTVTAKDPHQATDTITVTVHVTDVDERPEITAIAAGPATGLRISGSSSRSVAEGTTAVATYTASGPNAGSARWTRTGTDAGDFSISSSGVLTFAATPDYEAPADANGNNVYMVTVTATDSEGASDSIDVTVTVTDVDDTEQPTEPTNVVDEYDTDNSGRIDKSELADGVFDYEIERTLSKSDLADLIFSYEIGG